MPSAIVSRIICRHNKAFGTDYDPVDVEAFLQDHDINLPHSRMVYVHRSFNGGVRILSGLRICRLSLRSRVIDEGNSGTWVASRSLDKFSVCLLARQWTPAADLPSVPDGSAGCSAPLNGVAWLSVRAPLHLYGRFVT